MRGTCEGGRWSQSIEVSRSRSRTNGVRNLWTHRRLFTAVPEKRCHSVLTMCTFAVPTCRRRSEERGAWSDYGFGCASTER